MHLCMCCAPTEGRRVKACHAGGEVFPAVQGTKQPKHGYLVSNDRDLGKGKSIQKLPHSPCSI